MSLKLSVLFVVLGLFIVAAAFLAAPTHTAAPLASVNGQGSLAVALGPNGQLVRRQFSMSIRQNADGSVEGNAVLHNPEADGAHGNQPYMLQVDVSCMNVIGNIAFFGGTTRRTTDPNLVDAVYWSIEDNGTPGADNDELSLAHFFDDDPNTTGDPQLCLNNAVGDFPMFPILSGNITLK